MLSHRRWMVGLGIVIAGCCAAIPFQRQASTDPVPSERLTLSNPGDQLQLWLAAAESNPTSPPSQGLEDHHRIEALQLRMPSPLTAPRRPVQQVPSIENRYPVVAGEPDQETQQVSKSRWQRHETASDRYHRIQDGDTLRKLAEQYLGNADLAASIYNANRSILASPDLLPLGRQLRIPGPR
ncbi:MAG: LysM peptidoglycan-binding domain-containing protein [Pirellulaceae bacterium]